MKRQSFLALVICLLSAASGAQAQTGPTGGAGPSAPTEITNPSLPQNPMNPTDFQGTMAVPGTPQPGAGVGPAAAPAGPTGPGMAVGEEAEAAAISGGDMLPGGNPALYGGRTGRKAVPPYHTVSKGDTLWRICDYYYGDPWAWPQVWAHNKNITNPHWIYPGDQVKLLPGPAVGARTEQSEVLRVRASRLPSTENEILLRQNGFVDPTELEQSASIMGSPQERLLLSANDEIYIEGNNKVTPQAGQSYTIYRVREPLKNEKGEELGSLVEILGTARVKAVNDKGKKLSTAVITESLNPIEREDRVGPLRRRFVRLPVLPADRDVEGQVIATMRGYKHTGTDELVFLGRGRRQGVREGNRFLVVRKGDGYSTLMQERDDDNPKYPAEAFAEVTIVDVRDHAAVGLVTRATKEIRVGDKVRMRRGY